MFFYGRPIIFEAKWLERVGNPRIIETYDRVLADLVSALSVRGSYALVLKAEIPCLK